MPKITSAIDIGCGKICCMIAQNENNGDIKILGIGVKKSQGIYQGKIQDLTAVKKTVQSAIHLAETMAGINIGKNIITNINGLTPHMLTVERQLQLGGRAIRHEDIAALRNEARYHLDDPQQQLLHYFERGFYIDDSHDIIQNPLAQPATTLTVKASLLFIAKNHLMQFKKLFDECNLHVGVVVYNAYASAQSTLLQEEKNHGTLLLDIGSETTAICIYHDNIPIFCDIINFGGEQITADIANQLNIPIDQAERLKTLHGNLIETSGDRKHPINISDNNTITKSQLISIIKQRTKELPQHIEKLLQSHNIPPQKIKNIVITGGSANMQGFCEMLCFMFHRPTRLAKPLIQFPSHTQQNTNSNLLGLASSTTGSEFACIIGMLRYAASQDFHLGTFTAEHDGNAWTHLWHWVLQDPI